ncbi:DUF3954 domain-containing protein [Listeria booriae]|uniref:DUF3954 domain-containing protein n=1 Tax=Listeria booriae TaxID=1552123 RepID=A0A7X0XCZ1_9LIST|nr:DUF3954 domain-containing protein [Listeria booriae]MBC1373376.1 DUF3954 domain-containing protein [Listeria booriae]MBC1491931.1 DUF3954 domain-containing protein [Listeria booriae]MBC2389056.1 DUF3954 domain-containing protein [Listeria booriae]
MDFNFGDEKLKHKNGLIVIENGEATTFMECPSTGYGKQTITWSDSKAVHEDVSIKRKLNKDV